MANLLFCSPAGPKSGGTKATFWPYHEEKLVKAIAKSSQRGIRQSFYKRWYTEAEYLRQAAGKPSLTKSPILDLTCSMAFPNDGIRS